MKVLIAFAAVLAVAQGLFSHEFGVRATFGNPLTDFHKIPTSRDEAVADGWTLEDRPDTSYLSVLILYCHPDKTICVYFDDTYYFAGMQVAILKKNFKNCPLFDNAAVMANRGYKNWTTTVDGTTNDLYTISFFTIDEAALKTSAADRINSRNKDKVLQYDFISVEGPGGLRRIPTKQDDIKEEGVFTEQQFVVWMGKHDYYNMSKDTECTSGDLFPWFPLTHRGEMVALGLMTFGQYKFDSGKTTWFEYPPRAAVEFIVPHGPECMYKMVDDCGIFTMHTYFIADPCTSILFNN